MHYQIRSLDRGVDTTRFDCGEPALNDYLQHYATQDIKRGVARVFVATPTDQTNEVVGYYTLSAASIAAETLPEPWRKKMPCYPVPAAAAFYKHFGFLELPGQPGRWMLPRSGFVNPPQEKSGSDPD